MGLPDKLGYFGKFGGRFVPETLMAALLELEAEYKKAQQDKRFKAEIHGLLREYSGRPTLLYFAANLSREWGAKIYLKREDLNHTGAHKLNNCLGQALLAKRMGKRRVIAETGAGQHGVATATVAALFGFDCTVYMREEDIKRQRPNIQRMQLLGAEIIPVTAGTKTLKDATNVQKSLEMISSLREQKSLPLIILTYANPVHQYGLARFIREAKQAGVSGLIVADLVIEEANQIEKMCRSQGLDLIYLAAPTTNGSRLKRIARRSSGFVYLVSVTGVTGARRVIPLSLGAKINEIRRFTDKPVCVGFGISNPLQAETIARLADGIIVGSAPVDLIRESKNQAQMSRKISRFLISIKKGMEKRW